MMAMSAVVTTNDIIATSRFYVEPIRMLVIGIGQRSTHACCAAAYTENRGRDRRLVTALSTQPNSLERLCRSGGERAIAVKTPAALQRLTLQNRTTVVRYGRPNWKSICWIMRLHCARKAWDYNDT
jgi:hypothetical protein